MLDKLRYKLHRWQRTRPKKKKSWFSRSKKTLRWVIRTSLILLALDIFYLMHIWPDWQAFQQGNVKKSNFIKGYQQQRNINKALPKLSWKPVKLNRIPDYLRRAVIIGEDARFYSHNGFDINAFRDAMNYNIENKRFKYGGSTLSQQTVKNMFFSGSRSPLRKWHELIFTIGMEFNVSKDRILETYLNIAEFGKGIYGVDAAARSYWNIPVSALSTRQTIELAATLPSPVKHNPQTRSKTFLRRVQKISVYMY